MASGVGLNVPLISGCMFGLGAFLAAFGGVIGGPIFGVYPGLDFELLSLGFVVVIVGEEKPVGVSGREYISGSGRQLWKALFLNSPISRFLLHAIVVAVKPTGLFGRE